MFPDKKHALANVLTWTGLHAPLRSLSSRSLIVLTYHRLRKDDAGASADFTPFDAGVFGPTASEFRRTMAWLKRNVTILSEQDLLHILRHPGDAPERAVMITFDDGYRDNYDLALPVLTELKVPALFFIPYEQIDQRALGWWDTISYLIKRAPVRDLRFRGVVHPLEGDRSAAIESLLTMMKREPYEQTRGMLEELMEACKTELPTKELQSAELMSWEQIQETAQGGLVAIGSHTMSHRVLATLSLEEQRSELQRSKAMLESKLGRPIRTLAYPVGGYENFHLETEELAQDCGYQAAFSFRTGMNKFSALEPFNIRRSVTYSDESWLTGMMALPGLWLKNECDFPKPQSVGGPMMNSVSPSAPSEETAPVVSSSPEGLSVRTYETPEEAASMLPQYEGLLSQCPNTTIFSSWDWLGAWWRAYHPGELKLLAFFDSRSTLVGLAPLFVERSEIFPKLSLRNLRLVGDGSWDSDYLDFLVLPGWETRFAEALVRHLTTQLQWDTCELNTVPGTSPAAAAFEAAIQRSGWAFKAETSFGSCIELPSSWEGYLESISSNERRKLRYLSQRLEKQYQVEVRRWDCPKELEPGLEHLFALHQKRWNSKGEPGSFSSDERRTFYRDLGRQLLNRNALELWLLQLDGKAVAAQFGFRFRDTAYALQEGFDPDLTRESVGYVLRARVLKAMIESGVRYYDFLGGLSASKERWSAQPRAFKHLYCARPQTRGAMVLKTRWLGDESKAWLREHLSPRALHVLRRVRQAS